MSSTQVFRGAIWVTGASLLSRVATLVGTLLMTHLLSPEVMGEVGVASILALTASYISQIGFAQYLIARPKLDTAGVFQVTVLNAVTTVAALAIALVIAQPIGPLFGVSHLWEYFPGLALATLLQRLASIPSAIALRDMRFRAASLATAIPELVYAGSAVGLAAAGFGGHAMVLANIIQYGLLLVLFSAVVGLRPWLTPARFTRERNRDILRFGLPLLVSRVTSFVAASWDNMLISSFFGPGVLGLYNLGYNLAMVPRVTIGGALADVFMPSFAKMEAPAARVAVVRSIGLTCLVVSPLTVGLGAVSETLTETLFSAEWQGIGPYLLILATIDVLSPLYSVVHVYLNSRNMTRSNMWLGLLSMLLLFAGILIGQFYGSLMATVGVAGSQLIVAIWGAAVLQRVDDVPFKKVLRAIVGPVLACAVLFVSVLGCRHLLVQLGVTGYAPLRLGVEVTVGALAYVGAAFVFAPSQARDLLKTGRAALLRRRGQS